MRDYDFKLSEDSGPRSSYDNKGCRCSVAVGFLLVLLAIAIAVGVGIIVHFAGGKDDVTCNYNMQGSAVSDANVLQCAGLAAGNNRNICDACPQKSETTSPSVTASTPARTTPPQVDLSRLPTNVRPIVYTVFLQPDFYSNTTSEFRATGDASILVSCDENTSEIILHAVGMELTGGISVVSQTTMEDIYHSHTLNVAFGTVSLKTRKLMQKGQNYTILFQEFSYALRTDYMGFFYTWYERNGEKVYQAHTDLETSSTRMVFPCFDEPAFKAVFDFTIARKAGKRTLSNAELNKTFTGPGDWFYDVFKSSPVMSTYLIHIIVCDYDYAETTSSSGVPMKVWARSEAVNQTGFALDLSSRILTLFEDYFGIPYPLEKMDSISYVQYIWTAMENWGLIVYREDLFLLDDQKASYFDRINAALTISHEIAHNWFGNLVSPAWWDDLWLNEGFATYGEFLGVDMAQPSWKMADYLSYEATGKSMRTDGLMTSHPLYIPGITDLGQILGYFDSITYKKGCSLIKMMEFFVGKETFRKGLENYLKALSYGSAKHDDLWLAIGQQAEADNKTITNVKEIMDNWIEQMNYPVVDIEWAQAGRIRLSQKRYVENPNGTDPETFISGFKWHIPFTYTSSSEKRFDKDETSIIMMDAVDGSVSVTSDTIPDPSGNNWIIGNIQYLGYYRVNYDERNWNALIDQLISDHKTIGVANRVQIIHDSWALARSGDLSLDMPLRLFDYISSEDEMSPWFAFTDEVVYLHKLLYNHPYYEQFRAKMQTLFQSITVPTPTKDDIVSSGVKDRLTYLSCLFEVESCLLEAKTALDNINTTRINPTLSDTYYCTAVRHGGAKAWNTIYNMHQKENYIAERIRLLKALTCARERWLLAKTAAVMLDADQVYPNELWRIVYFMALNRDALPVVWDFYREHFGVVMARSGGFWGQQPILEIANSLNTDRTLAELKEFTAHTNMQGSQFFQQARERVENNIHFMDRLLQAMELWLGLDPPAASFPHPIPPWR